MLFKKSLSHLLSISLWVKSGLSHKDKFILLVLGKTHLGAECVVPELGEILPVAHCAFRDRIRDIKKGAMRVSFVAKHHFSELYSIDLLIGTEHGTANN